MNIAKSTIILFASMINTEASSYDSLTTTRNETGYTVVLEGNNAGAAAEIFYMLNHKEPQSLTTVKTSDGRGFELKIKDATFAASGFNSTPLGKARYYQATFAINAVAAMNCTYTHENFCTYTFRFNGEAANKLSELIKGATFKVNNIVCREGYCEIKVDEV